jgi:hypothetical protein
VKSFRRALWLLFHFLVASFAVLLVLVSLFPLRVKAQSALQVQITDIERRVGNFETLNLDHRLTAIETLLSSEDTWHRFSMGGTGLLICERIFVTFRRRRVTSGEESETE